MEDDKTLYKLIEQLQVQGLAFIANVPGEEESLAKIATRIGPVKDTFYGYTWDGKLVQVILKSERTTNAHCSPHCPPSHQRCVHVK